MQGKPTSWELGLEEAEALVNVLQERVELLVAEYHNSISNEIYDVSNFRVLGLLRILEEIFQHGMKQPDLGVVFWAYVRQLHTSLPGTQGTLDKVRATTDSPLGRGRVFIRLALNQNGFVDYLRALVWNTKLTNNFYTDFACLRSKQDEVCSALDSLQKLRFRLPLYSSELDRPDYWTLQAKKTIEAPGATEEFKFALSSVSEAERIRRGRLRRQKEKELKALEEENKKKAEEEERRRALLEEEKRKIEQELQALMELQRKEQEELLQRKLREQKEEEERQAKKRMEEERERKRREEQEMILQEALRLENEMAASRKRREEEKKRKERAALEELERKEMAAEDVFCHELRVFWKAKDVLEREQKRLQKEKEEAERKLKEEVERKLREQQEETERVLRKEREEAERRRKLEREESERKLKQQKEEEESAKRLAQAERSLLMMERKKQELIGLGLSKSTDSINLREVPAEGVDSDSDSGKEVFDELDQIIGLVQDHVGHLDSLVEDGAGSPGKQPATPSPPSVGGVKPLSVVNEMRLREQKKHQQRRAERGRGRGSSSPSARGQRSPTSPSTKPTTTTTTTTSDWKSNSSPTKGIITGTNLQAKDITSIRSAYYGRLLAQKIPSTSDLPSRVVAASVQGAVKRSKSLGGGSATTQLLLKASSGEEKEKEKEQVKERDVYSEGTVEQIPTTRPQWMDDKQVFACASCPTTFSYLVRKHHCRLCGLIYCSGCCNQKKDLPPDLGYPKPQLVCAGCINKYYGGLPALSAKANTT